jgi:hypothetical protein
VVNTVIHEQRLSSKFTKDRDIPFICLISVSLLTEIRQQLLNTPRDRAMPLSLPRPSPLTRIFCQRQFKTAASRSRGA